MNRSVLSISIISHHQSGLVFALLDDLEKYCLQTSFEVLLTINVPEALPDSLASYSFPVKRIENPAPLGFGENHNRAFQLATGDIFCVMNPDIRVSSNVFLLMLEDLKEPYVGVVAPLVVNKNGQVEDSARFFPTPLKIFCKALGCCKGSDYAIADACFSPDWVGGMFMVCKRNVYQKLGGFDERFFLYYEDVDLCARVWLKGLRVLLDPRVRVTHDARRSSHTKAKYLLHHLRSMARFFMSPTYWRVMCLRRPV